MRTRCVDGVGRARERAAATAWGLATSSSTRDEFVHAHVAPVRENSEAIEAYYKGDYRLKLPNLTRRHDYSSRQ